MSGYMGSASALPNDDELLDLLAERATAGLSDAAEAGLDERLASHEGTSANAFDEAAAALAVAFAASDTVESTVPESLQRSLRAAAAAFSVPAPSVELKLSGSPRQTDTDARDVEDLRREGRVPVLAWAGWLAAAAGVLLAVIVSAPARSLSPSQQMATLLASAGDAWEAQWSGLTGLALADTDHPRDLGVTGRVVWSDARNEGYMEIAGLEPNDPGEHQYQLWIFDQTRPTGEYAGVDPTSILSQRPVDGGVFDFEPGPDGTAVIPVGAKLPVGKGVIFAVTLEPPGGVVVSDRDIVFGAAAPAS